jgi:mycoredoxin
VPDVTVYWRPMCGYCETLKRSLERRGVAYDAVNIWERRDEAEVVKAANGGDELVPTVRVGERFMANPSLDEVLAALPAA